MPMRRAFCRRSAGQRKARRREGHEERGFPEGVERRRLRACVLGHETCIMPRGMSGQGEAPFALTSGFASATLPLWAHSTSPAVKPDIIIPYPRGESGFADCGDDSAYTMVDVRPETNNVAYERAILSGLRAHGKIIYCANLPEHLRARLHSAAPLPRPVQVCPRPAR